MLRSKVKKTLLVTLGDPAGVGAEVTAAALRAAKIPAGVEPVVIGNADIWRRFWKDHRQGPVFLHTAHDPKARHVPGKPTAASGRDALLYLEKAVDLIKAGRAGALVTAPVSKEAIDRFVPGFKGHTTWLADAFACKNVEMVFVGASTKLVLVTRHVPVKDLAGLITAAKVTDVISTAHQFLVERFGIKKPRIAVLGLNPHAGEGGHIGREELTAIIPAIKKCRARGMDVQGPFAADTFFEPRNAKGYDLIVAMYHDQGLIALKTLYFDSLVNLTVGLPFIRTSPVHGTAFGIAGKGKASFGSMKAAIELAARL